MDRKQLIQLLKEKGRYISPDGVVDITWLADEGRGFIDIVNPNNSYNFKQLKTKFDAVKESLPHGTWEFNPDTPQKGRIYKRLFPNSSPTFYGQSKFNSSWKGVLTHNSLMQGKSDIFPQKEMLQMLKRIATKRS